MACANCSKTLSGIFFKRILNGQNIRLTQIVSRNCSTSDKSTSETSTEETEYETKERILRASLPFVYQHGWTNKAITSGAEKEGLPGVAHGMFPRGGAELVFFFYRECNQQLVKQMKKQTENVEEKPKTGEFIKNSVESRLRMIIPYMEKWPQAMAIQTMPQNAIESWTNLGRLMDEIWFYAGDQSVDFNWYTKRASLAGVYKSTEIYMLQDRSENYENTWQFLDRRLKDLTTFGKVTRNVKQSGTVASEGLYGLGIMAKNMCRMNSR